MNILTKFCLPLLALVLSFSSCVDENFDTPPTSGNDPGLTVTTTIAELKAMHSNGNFETINQDLVIKGTVVADDASGNWYRSFVMQDETGGITLLIDITESYFLYPVGREVYVKLNGLVLGDYNNLIQLGGYVASDGSLGEIVEVTDHLIKSVKKAVPVPKVLTIDQLSIDDVSTLVQFDDVLFLDTTGTYADAVNQNSLNVDLADCDGNTVIVRTSGFADFAGASVASGGGTFVGVLSVFRQDFQLLIRDLNDINMSGDRCGVNPGNPCDGVTPVIVSGVDEDFQNGANNDLVMINGWFNVATKGTRTWQFKEFQGNIYAQATAFNDSAPEMETWLVTPLIDMNEAKTLTFETAKAFYTNDGLTAWVSTDFVCDPLQAIWQPLNATLAGQSDNDNDWIPSGDVDLSAFVGQKIVIGFRYQGSGPNAQTGSFRLDNLKIGDGGVGPVDPCNNGNPPLEVATLNEDFTGGVNNDPVVVLGWTNIAGTGTRSWQFKEFDTNVYAQATAFNDSSPEMSTWLVTPLIDVTSAKTLRFETAKAFWTHDGLTAWTSTDFDCDPLTATWVPLAATLAGQNDPDHDWIPSGDIDLSSFIGSKVAIGFKYEGNNNAGLTTSYRVDNVIVE